MIDIVFLSKSPIMRINLVNLILKNDGFFGYKRCCNNELKLIGDKALIDKYIKAYDYDTYLIGVKDLKNFSIAITDNKKNGSNGKKVIDLDLLGLGKALNILTKEFSLTFVYKKKLIVMASGLSKRFGRDDKLLQCIDGKKLYLHLLDKLHLIVKDDELVVVVARKKDILNSASNRGFLIIENTIAHEGISTSIRLGLSILEEFNIENTVFFTADQPYLKKETIEEFLRLSSRNKEIFAVSGSNGVGNPVCFNKKYYSMLAKLKGDVGGKRVVKENISLLSTFMVDDRELYDIDFKEDI